VKFTDVAIQSVSPEVMLKAIILAVLCAVVSIIFCVAIGRGEHYLKKIMPNIYVRAFAGGLAVALLTLAVGVYDYNGAGMDIITDALGGNARPEAFILKIIFTVLTISAGFKGGEIVPTFFIGSTFGCVAGGLLGLEPGFGAALGFVALFCSVVNCPVASVMLALEVFGGQSILVFALVCGVSYMMSGYFGLYRSQKIAYSKLNEDFIDINTKH
jgi:H+/Cl- antiporter ClcA